MNERLFLDHLVFEPGAIYIMDRGYTAFERLRKIDLAGAFFLIRAKRDLNFLRIESLPVDKVSGVRLDQIIRLGVPLSQHYDPDELRPIKLYDSATDTSIVVLTNKFLLDPLTIGELYRSRWRVVLFFKWIKQHLRIKAFYGTSFNAVNTQIWIALTVYVLVAIAANPHLDEVIVARRPRGLARLGADIAVARDLRRRKFDVAIDLHGGPRASWLTLACGARERIGYAVPGRWWMYTRRHARDPHAHDRHSVENQWVLVRELHSSLDRRPDRHRDPVEMAEDPVAAARLDARLASAGIEAGAIVIVVHVGAGNRFRQWPAGHFAELVGRLAENAPNRRIILITGREGAGLAARVAAEAQARLHSIHNTNIHQILLSFMKR